MLMVDKLLEKIESRKAVIGVVGLGYVGLPLIREFSAGGAKVLGFDVDSKKVKSLLAGKSYIDHIPNKEVKEIVKTGRFDATTDFKRLKQADCILICVPTPLTKMREPDMTYVIATARSIVKTLRKGQLVVLESTTYPGTTREVMLPILEESGLKVGKDFFLAFSPEREDPGRKDYSTKTIPKVVGGHDKAGMIKLPLKPPSPAMKSLSTPSCPYQAAKPPKPARSSKTHTAALTSHWSTN
jgi:UDP-N-acetyl-D-glucosamine dehydrogenase